jgi:predicted nucleotide-binding protein
MVDEIKQYGLREKDMVSWEECLRVWKHIFERAPRGILPRSGNIIEVCKELDIDELTAKEIGSRLEAQDYIRTYRNGDFNVKQQGLRSINQISNQLNDTVNNRKVFVVHGHDEALRETVARFLERLGLFPIILHEQPNRGRTIIEKFTDYSDVCFAVVLLTADDRGGSKEAPIESYQPRARQNVILELGFFLGKLGRDNVCALYERGVEIPSDFHGVLFIEADNAGAWRLNVAREIKASGVEIDLNRAV